MESYFQDMRKVAEKQHTPSLKGLGTLSAERKWEVEVVPLVVGQRSVKEKEWREDLRIFGIGKEDGKRIIDRLGHTLLNEHEKLFGSYWRHTFGPSSSLLQLLGKGIAVRASQPPQGGSCLPASTGRFELRSNYDNGGYSRRELLVRLYIYSCLRNSL
jgi:hypothetical protein